MMAAPTTTKLTLAIPSKGRLKDNCNAWFASAGVTMEQTVGARGYRASFAGFPDVEVMLLSAGEIASSLLAGDIHLGITGEDLLREEAPEGRMQLLKPLGFGFADVVVAVSQYWVDVATMADLDDVCAAYAQTHRRRLRVATKYAQLTRSFFAQARITDYRIVPSAGATEGAPAAGTAEVIVDITTTGATLKDNGLKVLDDGVILKSQAQLAASLSADWSAEARDACRRLLDKLDPASPLFAGLAAHLPA
jgi:ATP phosphoribosyltransferase